jgi:hypothetical protein
MFIYHNFFNNFFITWIHKNLQHQATILNLLSLDFQVQKSIFFKKLKINLNKLFKSMQIIFIELTL